jgi:hypothetical protein
MDASERPKQGNNRQFARESVSLAKIRPENIREFSRLRAQRDEIVTPKLPPVLAQFSA